VLVCAALEDRGLPQNPQVWLSGRGVRLVAVCCILSWRIFWMTMINRIQPEAPPTVALTQLELDLLDRLFPEKTKAKTDPALGSYLVRIARLGGYL
jgi:hypothetical protein